MLSTWSSNFWWELYRLFIRWSLKRRSTFDSPNSSIIALCNSTFSTKRLRTNRCYSVAPLKSQSTLPKSKNSGAELFDRRLRWKLQLQYRCNSKVEMARHKPRIYGLTSSWNHYLKGFGLSRGSQEADWTDRWVQMQVKTELLWAFLFIYYYLLRSFPINSYFYFLSHF